MTAGSFKEDQTLPEVFFIGLLLKDRGSHYNSSRGSFTTLACTPQVLQAASCAFAASQYAPELPKPRLPWAEGKPGGFAWELWESLDFSLHPFPNKSDLTCRRRKRKKENEEMGTGLGSPMLEAVRCCGWDTSCPPRGWQVPLAVSACSASLDKAQEQDLYTCPLMFVFSPSCFLKREPACQTVQRGCH